MYDYLTCVVFSLCNVASLYIMCACPVSMLYVNIVCICLCVCSCMLLYGSMALLNIGVKIKINQLINVCTITIMLLREYEGGSEVIVGVMRMYKLHNYACISFSCQ